MKYPLVKVNVLSKFDVALHVSVPGTCIDCSSTTSRMAELKQESNRKLGKTSWCKMLVAKLTLGWLEAPKFYQGLHLHWFMMAASVDLQHGLEVIKRKKVQTATNYLRSEMVRAFNSLIRTRSTAWCRA